MLLPVRFSFKQKIDTQLSAGEYYGYRDSDIFKKQTSHGRWLDDGLFSSSAEMVRHLSARFYKSVRVVRAISPGREGIIWPVDPLILSYQLGVPYCPERCPKKETFFG